MRTQPPSERDTRGQRGATLIVTLGILTVLSILAVTFLIAARIQRQAAANKQSRFIARNYMDAGLYQAIRQIENALTYPNYTEPSQKIPEGAYLTRQRLVPVGHWFSYEYGRTNDPNIAYQAADVLASPTERDAPTVNLLSPAVMRFVPAALTNGLQLSSRYSLPFRSGWIRLFEDHSAEEQLLTRPGRVAYLVFNCSGFADANTFQSGPTTQKLQRICFNQADVTNWLDKARTMDTEPFKTLFSPEVGLDADPLTSPFFHLSYDPGPDVYPLDYDCFETCSTVGQRSFGAGPTVDLNLPQAYKAMQALKRQATYLKFNLNSLTNFLALGTQSTDTKSSWFNDARFKAEWLDPVTFLIEMMRHEEPATTVHRWPRSSDLAWTIANFMDADRIPQVSDFPTDGASEPELATRVNYAVEDVPLINKVTVFNIYDQHEDIKAPQKPSYYGLPTSGLSNHYAVAVEYWYPFAPNPPCPPNRNAACYVGIYTNAADVQTTTNRPWTASELRDWFRWNNIDNSNSVMRALFDSWARAFTNQVGPSIANQPVWQNITDQLNLWGTPAMTNLSPLSEADTNSAFSITDTPLWQAFYPATYEVVTTNEIVTATNTFTVVTTNIFTFADTTNSYVETVSDGSTNRLIGQIGTWFPEPYPILLWTNLTTSVSTTNVLGGIIDENGTTNLFVYPPETNLVVSITATSDGVLVVVSNAFSGIITTNRATTFYQSPADTNTLSFVLSTNTVFTTTEITPIEPLHIPADLGLALSTLFLMMPTNSLPSLYTFLMLTPDEFTPDMWRNLLDTFNQNPSILNRLMPSHQAPTLGGMTEKDRHILWPENIEDDTVVPDPKRTEKLVAKDFQGYFWTVYPKQTVSFMEVVDTTPVKVEGGPEPEHQAVTNYQALGRQTDGKINTIWLRPVTTTINPSTDAPAAGEGLPENDVIVDEALLSHNGDDPVPVWGWTSVTNLCIPEPRNNAYARDWRAFPFGKQWTDPDVLNTTNLNTDVHELPFMHFDAPFSSIGDLGHIYVAYERDIQDPGALAVSQQLKYDTLTFSTRAGAALLDIFTLNPTNSPKRGLVQANTQQRPVIQTLLSDVKIGWTNVVNGVVDLEGWQNLGKETKDKLKGWTDVYADALTNAPYSMGWRSYADMLPALSTNRLFSEENVWGNSAGLHSMHDYTEDVLRGIVDKVSFRQNIFVIVVASQALSPASTDTHPIMLAEQRAAVTVIRDAYTGKWLVHSWVWLTE